MSFKSYFEPYRLVLLRAWNFLIEPAKEWGILLLEKQENKAMREDIFAHRLFAVALFWSAAMSLFYAEGRIFQSFLLGVVETGCALFGGYWLSMWLAKQLVGKFGVPMMDRAEVKTLITYSFITFVAGHMLVALLPNSQYLYVIDGYAAYLLYRGLPCVVQRDDYEVINPTVVIVLVEIISVVVCSNIIKVLFPNW